MQTSDALRREIADAYLIVIARSGATKQSIWRQARKLDCFAALAMTRGIDYLLYGAGAVSHGGGRIRLERLCLRTIFGFMAPRRTSQNYTIEPFRMGPDQNAIGLLYLNFRAENLASAQAQAMIYLRNDAFVKDIDGVKLLRNAAEVWRWSKAKAAP